MKNMTKNILMIIFALTCTLGTLKAQDTLDRPAHYLYQQKADTVDMTVSGLSGYLANHFLGKEFVVSQPRTIYGIAATYYCRYGHYDGVSDVVTYAMAIQKDSGQYIRIDSVRRIYDTIPDHYYVYRYTVQPGPDAIIDCQWRTPEIYIAPLYEFYFKTPLTVHDTFYLGFKCFHKDHGDNFDPEKPLHYSRYLHLLATYSIDSCYEDTCWWLNLYRQQYYPQPTDAIWRRFPVARNSIFGILTPPDTDRVAECPVVEGFSLQRYYNHTPIFQWADTATRDYQIAYGPAGVPPDSCRIVPCNGWPYRITDNTLDSTILYHAFIRQMCHHDCWVHDTNYWSAWSEPVSFYTGEHAPDTGRISIYAPQPLAFSLTPNPAHDHVVVSADGEGPYQVAMHDETGRQLVSFSSQESVFSLNLSALPAGMYYLTVKSGQRVGSQKVVKQ